MKEAMNEAMRRRKSNGMDLAIIIGPHAGSEPMKPEMGKKMGYTDNDALENSDDGKEDDQSLGLAPAGKSDDEKSELKHELAENELLGKMDKLQARRTQEAAQDVAEEGAEEKEKEEMEAAMLGNLDPSEKRRILEAKELSLRDAMIKSILEKKGKA